MKLIMVWGDDNPGTEHLFNTLKRHGHTLAYWVGIEGGRRFSPPGSIFHLHEDAWDARPAHGCESWMIPPPASLIEKLYHVESITLTMMDKRYDAANVSERKQSYYEMVGYWSRVLDEVQPDAVLCPSLPHGVYNYVLWELARLRGIKTICFEEVWFLQSLIEFNDFWKGSDALRSALLRNLKKGIAFDDLSSVSREYLISQEKASKPPAYMDFQKSIAVGWGLAQHRLRILRRSFFSGTFFSLILSYLKRRFQRNLIDEYNEVVGRPDLSEPFVYFALPMQPERTTSPQGGIFHDQILTAQMLSAALPKGWKLYIKEHPSQWWLRSKTRFTSARYPGFYKRLARIPNACIVPMKTSNYTLIENATCVAVVNGTPGWEAILRGKTPIIFGIPWYRDCPGVLQVSSVDECKKAFAAIEAGQAIQKNELYAYIKALEETTVDAYLEDHTIDPAGTRKTIEESMHSLAKHLCESLKA